MAVHRTPLEFDVRDPNFPRQCVQWSRDTQSEIATTIALTEKELAVSRAIMSQVDRILAWRA